MATHVEFIWSQLHNADSRGSLTKHLKQPLWQEILPTDLRAVPPAHPNEPNRNRCVVTASVGDLFKWIFGEGIEIIEPSMPTVDCMDISILTPSPKYYSFHHDEYGFATYTPFTTSIGGNVNVGDVVEFTRET